MGGGGGGGGGIFFLTKNPNLKGNNVFFWGGGVWGGGVGGCRRGGARVSDFLYKESISNLQATVSDCFTKNPNLK